MLRTVLKRMNVNNGGGGGKQEKSQTFKHEDLNHCP